jgi:hypothetical protein
MGFPSLGGGVRETATNSNKQTNKRRQVSVAAVPLFLLLLCCGWRARAESARRSVRDARYEQTPVL